jgi:hypothetical protein
MKHGGYLSGLLSGVEQLVQFLLLVGGPRPPRGY